MRRLFALASVLAVVLAACGGATPGASQTSAPTAVAATDAPATYKAGDKITLYVPYAAGGGFDIYTRTVQPYVEQALEKALGFDVSVAVENLAGANGQLAVENVFRATDGKSVVFAGLDITASQQVIAGAAFDMAKFHPLGQIAKVDRSLMIRPGVLSANGTFKDLIERSKTKPILYGGSGQVEVQKLTFAILKEGGLDLRVDTVDFPGTAQAVASLLRGEIETFDVTLPTAVAQVKANPSLRVLVNFAAERSTLSPDTPTLKEAGIPGADRIAETTGSSVRIYWAAPQTPPGNVRVLEQAFRSAIGNAEFQDKSAKLGNPVSYADPKSISTRLAASLKLYQDNKALLLAK